MENFITLTPRGQTFGFQILKSFLTPRKKEEKEKAEQSRGGKNGKTKSRSKRCS